MNKLFEHFNKITIVLTNMSIKKYLVLIIVCTLAACNDSDDKKVIDLMSYKSKEIQLGSIHKVIPLESSIDSNLGFITKSVVDFENDRVFVLSRFNLYIYNTNGKFLKKAPIGRGPSEFIRIMSFTINSNNKKLYVLNDPKNITVLSYDLDVISSYEYREFHCSDIQLIDNNNLLLYNYATHKEGQGFFVGIYNLEKGKIIRKQIPISESPYHRFTVITSKNFPKYGNRQFFTSPNIFGLYEFKEDSFIRINDYFLGSKAVPERISNRYLKKKRRRIFRQESILDGYIPFILNTFKFKDNYIAILDDSENNCVVIPENNNSDIYMNGPISEYLGLPPVHSLNNPVGIYENNLVFSLLPNELFTNKDMDTPKEISIGQQKLSVKYDSNPILIIIR
ncbi:MAG: hypothetical protein CR996_00845 [Draconibacterium sp.]|nr:MAG: hypothetical protein CR996_00845 [Draconibacterium sp.]